MHLFTVIQMAVFILLYAVKAIKPIAIAFPVVIALCIPFRMYVLPRIFTEKELVMIDSDDAVVAEWLSNNTKELDDDDKGGAGTPSVQSMTSDEQFPASTSRRPGRTKAMSCPNDMLFAEIPMVTAVVTTLSQVPEDETVEDTTGVPRQRRRGTRTKTMSCPAHMLFAEANRHSQANYFFG